MMSRFRRRACAKDPDDPTTLSMVFGVVLVFLMLIASVGFYAALMFYISSISVEILPDADPTLPVPQFHQYGDSQ